MYVCVYVYVYVYVFIYLYILKIYLFYLNMEVSKSFSVKNIVCCFVTALKVVITTALQMAITELSNAVLGLSTPVCNLFNMLQDRCTEENITTAHDCVGLQASFEAQ